MAKVGRPKKQIDKGTFEKLCKMQCTESEICAWFETTDKTLNGWCNDNYNMNFSEIFKEKREMGKISLRRCQFQLAEKNPTMAIWLGKQYLGQRDKFEDERVEIEDIAQVESDIFGNNNEN